MSGAAARPPEGGVSPSRRQWLVRRILPLLLAPYAAAASAQPARYEIDPEHLSIGFLVDHIGYAKVIGLFRTAKGSFRFDDAAGMLSDVRIEIDTASVFTNHDKRDEHLRGRDFLDVKRFPTMVFTAERAERRGERDFVVAGRLALLGNTGPVTLNLRWNKSGRYELGFFRPWVIGASGRGSFRRSDFGMRYGVDDGLVGDEVELMIEFEARRQ